MGTDAEPPTPFGRVVTVACAVAFAFASWGEWRAARDAAGWPLRGADGSGGIVVVRGTLEVEPEVADGADGLLVRGPYAVLARRVEGYARDGEGKLGAVADGAPHGAVPPGEWRASAARVRAASASRSATFDPRGARVLSRAHLPVTSAELRPGPAPGEPSMGPVLDRTCGVFLARPEACGDAQRVAVDTHGDEALPRETCASVRFESLRAGDTVTVAGRLEGGRIEPAVLVDGSVPTVVVASGEWTSNALADGLTGSPGSAEMLGLAASLVLLIAWSTPLGALLGVLSYGFGLLFGADGLADTARRVAALAAFVLAPLVTYAIARASPDPLPAGVWVAILTAGLVIVRARAGHRGWLTIDF